LAECQVKEQRSFHMTTVSANRAPAVTDNVDRQRYELTVDGEVVGHLAYTRSEGQVFFSSTVVEQARRGRGLAALLVEHAVREARSESRSISTGCWYVQDWLDVHPAT
jgi:predicted GNAT family acetyltransferase